MSVSSIGLILLSSLFHALWNILTQTSKNSNFFSGLKGAWIMGLGAVLFFFFDEAYFTSEILRWAVLSGILHGLYILSLSRAYSTQDISYVYPIARSAPVFVPAFAWLLLDERLHPQAFPAIIFILIAIYTLHFKGHLLKGFKDLFGAVLHKDLRWAFITLALVVSYSLVDKKGMEVFLGLFPERKFSNGFVFFFLESFLGFALCNLYLFWKFSSDEIFSVWKQEWRRGIVAGLATIGSYGLICVVLQFEAVSNVVAVRQTSVLMVVFWGCWKLGEPLGKTRMTAAILIIVGVALIGWSPQGL